MILKVSLLVHWTSGNILTFAMIHCVQRNEDTRVELTDDWICSVKNNDGHPDGVHDITTEDGDCFFRSLFTVPFQHVDVGANLDCCTLYRSKVEKVLETAKFIVC